MSIGVSKNFFIVLPTKKATPTGVALIFKALLPSIYVSNRSYDAVHTADLIRSAAHLEV